MMKVIIIGCILVLALAMCVSYLKDREDCGSALLESAERQDMCQTHDFFDGRWYPKGSIKNEAADSVAFGVNGLAVGNDCWVVHRGKLYKNPNDII